MHILLIDDSSSTRSLLRTLINSGQTVRHEISEAASGEEALQKVGSGEINLPDLIIMDINMGGMSGYELCREFRQRHGTASEFVPYIIIVTANEGVRRHQPGPRLRRQRLHAQAGQRENPAGAPARGRAAADPGPAPPAAAGLPNPNATLSASGRVLLKPEPSAAAKDAAKEAAGEEANSDESLETFVALAVENADAPVAILDVSGTPPGFVIYYANAAMSQTTQFSREELLGQSLAEIEAWTPEFIDMVVGYIDQGSIVSHAPLWSHTRQTVPVHLSFYPIRTETGDVAQYLVVHHF